MINLLNIKYFTRPTNPKHKISFYVFLNVAVCRGRKETNGHTSIKCNQALNNMTILKVDKSSCSAISISKSKHGE